MQRTSGRLLSALAVAFLLLAPAVWPACAASPATNPRVERNPLLAEIARERPEALPTFLRELDALEPPSDGQMSTRGLQPTPPVASPEAPVPILITPALSPPDAALLRANPDLAAAYDANPDPMLGLLRRMISAAGGH